MEFNHQRSWFEKPNNYRYTDMHNKNPICLILNTPYMVRNMWCPPLLSPWLLGWEFHMKGRKDYPITSDRFLYEVIYTPSFHVCLGLFYRDTHRPSSIFGWDRGILRSSGGDETNKMGRYEILVGFGYYCIHSMYIIYWLQCVYNILVYK